MNCSSTNRKSAPQLRWGGVDQETFLLIKQLRLALCARCQLSFVVWILTALLVLPAAVYAQQDTASRDQKPQEKTALEAAQAQGKTEEKPAEETQAKTEKDKVISGMSILGNQEAPKSLVIVPWKSSELGDSIGISTKLDDSKQPVDKEVFMRALRYYEIRSNTTLQDGAPAANAAPPTAAAATRKKQ